MKKMKKIFALLLAVAMVLGMTTTAFAATKESATITVSNAENATLTYAQVIVPDTKTVTGWTFASEESQSAYLDAFDVDDAQLAIAMLIKAENASASLHSSVDSATAASAAQIDKALSNLTTNGVAFTTMTNPQTVTSAGVYAIKATEEGYTYKTMAAYVGFGEVENYTYPSLLDAIVVAKKTPTTVTKETTDNDKAVAIDDIITYTITMTVPYIDANTVDKFFTITDIITGADYVLVENSTTEVAGTVEMQGAEGNVGTITLDKNNDHKFVIDLTSLITPENSNAGKTITVTYQAKITDLTTNNRAQGHVPGSDFGSNDVDVYTGKITLTKYAEGSEETLAGAGFNVFKDEFETALTFGEAVVAEDGTNVYTYDSEGTVTEVVTGSNGKLVVQGLDVGSYHFVEITAPEGYSINENGADAELKVDETTPSVFVGETSLEDTKLNALPSTGGIGTTIFTIGGCAIMIAAAFFFFVSRRKDA